MSVISTIVDAINPSESEATHREARSKARAAAQPGDWLAVILQHHEQIETAFAAVKGATTAAAQRSAQRQLALILTGHANAEESVIYPALSRAEKKGEATTAYSEQAAAKQEMAELDLLEPLSSEYLQRLEHLRDAVAHHVYEEEGTWFIALRHNVTLEEQTVLGRRYLEEFDRYVGRDLSKVAPSTTESDVTVGAYRSTRESGELHRPMT